VIGGLTSAKHVVVKALWLENGANICKRHLYVFSQENIEKVGGGLFFLIITLFHRSRGIGRWSIDDFLKAIEECVKIIWKLYQKQFFF
jgi:hypothetical protein